MPLSAELEELDELEDFSAFMTLDFLLFEDELELELEDLDLMPGLETTILAFAFLLEVLLDEVFFDFPETTFGEGRTGLTLIRFFLPDTSTSTFPSEELELPFPLISILGPLITIFPFLLSEDELLEESDLSLPLTTFEVGKIKDPEALAFDF